MKRFVAICCVLTLVSCGEAGPSSPEEPLPATSTTAESTTTTVVPPSTEALPETQADVVFHNGVVLTIEDEKVESAIAVEGERILDIGNSEQMLAFAGPDTVVVDLEGRTLMPGFVDAHSHILNNPWRQDVGFGVRVLLANGITTSAELFVEEDLIEELQSLDRAGELRARISLYPVHIDNCGSPRGDWYSARYPVSREPGAMLQIPGIKIFNDGGSCNAPAVSFEYPGGIGRGDLYFEAPELADMIVAAQEAGYQVAIHGLGDRAIEANLDAIEIALAGEPNTFRHRIEHNTLLRDDMLARYSEVDVVALIFGHFPTCAFVGDTSPFRFRTPGDYLDWEWRWRPLIDTNPDLHVAWHSDTPYSIGAFPLRHLQSFVTRTDVRDDGSVCEPPGWAADDRLTVDEALRIMTIEGAYALWRDDEIGSLRPGKLADLIVLSADPREVEPDTIGEIEVMLTMVGGRVEHCEGVACDWGAD